MAAPRFAVGIDLGTTNTVLAYIDLLEEGHPIHILSIEQEDIAGATSAAEILPSSIFIAPESGEPKVGIYAREQAAYLPSRVINSSKSWLCYGGEERYRPVLPWGSDEVEIEHKRSPVQSASILLQHLSRAWDSSIAAFEPSYILANQHVTITVPASFDEVSQRLTLEAAYQANLPRSTRLLEEPQAAFYAWLRDEPAQETTGSNEHVLVCDIGGGTSDFSLFRVSAGSHIERIAVGEHVLLGGDNIDLSLAHRIEEQLGSKLSARQWSHLVWTCRTIKERALDETASTAEEEIHISIPAEGSSLFGGTLSASITTSTVRHHVLEGFFPLCESTDRPVQTQTGLSEWGLPYAKDSAISRHLAAFLDGRRVDGILFNGGTLAPTRLRERLLETIASWQELRVPRVLHTERADLAVARGAAQYTFLSARRSGQTIRAGYPRSVYLEVKNEIGDSRLVCILQKGFDSHELQRIPDLQFKLLLNTPVRFQLYTSSRTEALGALSDIRSDTIPLASLETVLSQSGSSSVRTIEIAVQLNELGLLQVYCIEPSEDQKWELHFNLRREDAMANIAELPSTFPDASELVLSAFGKRKVENPPPPKSIVKQLESLFGAPKEQWSTSLLRALWSPLSEGITRRSRSLPHEIAWLQLTGFILRPGFGAPLDSWRMTQLWRLFELGLAFPKEQSANVQWWILWRRVAGGLSADQQQLLLRKTLTAFEKKEDPEALRLLGSLERISVQDKERLVLKILPRLEGRKVSGIHAHTFALGHLLARAPLYASAEYVVPETVVAQTFRRLSPLDWRDGERTQLRNVFLQACRKTGDRSRDISLPLLEEIIQKLVASGVSEDQLVSLRQVHALNEADKAMLFGEALPVGLSLL